jgi:hypothetical protein
MVDQIPKPLNTTLLALTTAALALPGISPVSKAATTAPTETKISYRLTSYQKEDLPSAQIASGGTSRYEIDIQQIGLIAPVNDSFSLEANLQKETLSGASPWSSVDADNDGDIDLIMSGASIKEERTDFRIQGNYYQDESRFGLNFSHSEEDDYLSKSMGADWEKGFNNKQTTVNSGFSFSSDVINPQDSAKNENIIDPAIDSERLESSSLFFGLGQVIDKNRLVQSGLSITSHDGYLSDPYKQVDRRPQSRSQLTWMLRYRHYVEQFKSAIHLDYRFYRDSWGIKSHTFKFAWYKRLSDRWQLVPFARYYSQSKAKFYTAFDDSGSSEKYFSSDASLSQYGAISGGLKYLKPLITGR